MSRFGNYKHYVPPAPVDPNFRSKITCTLVQSLDHLKEIFNLHSKEAYMSFDTETSDLSPEVGHIVGFSFAFNNKVGYYVPVKHSVGSNLGEEALYLIYNRMLENKLNFFFNSRFDMRFMEYAGFDMSAPKIYDVSLGCWFADTNVKMPSMKSSSLLFLGWEMTHFEEALGDSTTFFYVDPEVATDYAATDALVTFALAGATLQYYQEAGQSGVIDNRLLYPLMKMEDNKYEIDLKYLDDIETQYRKELSRLEQSLYSQAGQHFNIGSGKQLADVLQSLGINTEQYTKAGYMRTSIPLLRPIMEKTGNQFLKDLLRYKEVFKSINSYISSLRKSAMEKGGFTRYSYITNNAPTGRLACGADKKNTYFTGINLQSAPKSHSVMWNVRPLQEGEEGLLGYKFYLPSEEDKFGPSDYQIEGRTPDLNFRRAYIVPKGFLHVSIDFCIDPDAIIYTNHGEMRLRDLEGGEGLKVLTPEGFKPVSNFHYTGKKQKVKINLKSGKTLICSPDHRIKVTNVEGNSLWKQVKDILPTDSIEEQTHE